VIAERSAKMGLPEILFNLFPAWEPIVCSRAASAEARRGNYPVGTNLHGAGAARAGVVDILAEDGAERLRSTTMPAVTSAAATALKRVPLPAAR